MIETGQKKERLILVGVSAGEGEELEASLDELEELVRTAGGEAAGRLMQKRETVHPATYLGKGKLEELRNLIYSTQADGIVCDDELSPAQLRNIEELLDAKILDRTLLILDIFAARASTREGKIQVEMAQLRYRATRLAGLGKSLSRLGGGIGTRGPGEKKLEVDRRLIHERIGQLKAELKQVEKNRQVQRANRMDSLMLRAALVGYTNAGKSTLLNHLTNACVLAEDKLFATLDPTTRVLALDSGEEVLLTDTVGFIRKLPHFLIEAFKSTLEEARQADVILHVVDVTGAQMETQMHVVYETLRQLQIEDKICVTVFNKIDRLTEPVRCRDFRADYTVAVSARTGEGFEDLKDILRAINRSRRVYLEQVFSYKEAGKIAQVRRYGQLLSEEYLPEGIAIRAWVPAELAGSIGRSAAVKEDICRNQ